jgi:hypothetical protein
LPTRDPSASFRFHQRKHFRVIQKSTLRRTRPMRAHDHFVTENNNRSDRELVELKASSRFPQRLGHELLVALLHPRDRTPVFV